MSEQQAQSAAMFVPQTNIITEFVTLNARWRPKRTALVVGGQRMDWGTLDERANRVANGLHALGIRKGDAVATLLPNVFEALEIMLGVLRSGAVLVPLSTMLTADTLAAMAGDARIRAAFVHRNYASLLSPGSVGAGLVKDGWIAVAHDGEGWTNYADWSAAQPGTTPQVTIAGEDSFNIIYSSGTTGVPKGIVHSHAARFNFACARIADFRLFRDSVALVTTPLYHNGSMLMVLPALLTGATIVVMPHFDASDVLDLIERERCTHTFMVPSQYVELVARDDFTRRDLSSMVTALTAGAAIRRDIKAQVLEVLGDAFMELYGATEGFSITIRGSDMQGRMESVGTPVIGVDVRIVGDDDREVAPGQVGELCGRSPYLMNCYQNQPELTADALWRDEQGRTYYRSGDLGRRDADGFFYISGRKKEMIISGGINIYTDDLERVLNEHPAVSDSAVIGVPHDKWGETPVAYIVPAASGPADPIAPSDIAAWVNERLGKFQRISEVRFINTLPRNAMGKVVKGELRARYAEGKPA